MSHLYLTREAIECLEAFDGVTLDSRDESLPHDRIEAGEPVLAHGISTLATLGALTPPLPFTPQRGSADAFTRVHEQARLQLQSRDRTPPLYELRPIVEGEGLSRLPEPSAGDLFIDLAGDNLAFEHVREFSLAS